MLESPNDPQIGIRKAALKIQRRAEGERAQAQGEAKRALKALQNQHGNKVAQAAEEGMYRKAERALEGLELSNKPMVIRPGILVPQDSDHLQQWSSQIRDWSQPGYEFSAINHQSQPAPNAAPAALHITDFRPGNGFTPINHQSQPAHNVTPTVLYVTDFRNITDARNAMQNAMQSTGAPVSFVHPATTIPKSSLMGNGTYSFQERRIMSPGSFSRRLGKNLLLYTVRSRCTRSNRSSRSTRRVRRSGSLRSSKILKSSRTLRSCIRTSFPHDMVLDLTLAEVSLAQS